MKRQVWVLTIVSIVVVVVPEHQVPGSGKLEILTSMCRACHSPHVDGDMIWPVPDKRQSVLSALLVDGAGNIRGPGTVTRSRRVDDMSVSEGCIFEVAPGWIQ